MKTAHRRLPPSLLLSAAAGALLLAAALGACGDDPESTADATSDAATDVKESDAEPDATPDEGPAPDAAPDAADVATGDIPPVTDTLFAGAAVRSLRAPIGAPTAGFGPSFGANAPSSRFADAFPATNRKHTDLTVKALVLRRAGKAVVLARLDLVGIWMNTVEDVRARLVALGRPDLAEGVVLSATHTHSGPGRFIDHFIGNIAADTFSPEMFKRISDAVVEAVVEADANSVPARVGHKAIQVATLHSDRRCENGPIQDDTMGLIKVESVDGDLLALVVNYAMHGTIVGASAYTLSSDAPGAVETGIEARLPAGVPVMYFQSWAGDMSPSDTRETYATEQGTEPEGDYIRLDALAAAAGDAVAPALDDFPMSDQPDLGVVTVHAELSGTLANPDGVFDEYPYGGIYCVSSDGRCGPDAEPFTSINCLGLPEDGAVDRALVSAARIGDLMLVTIPGEPTTQVGTGLRDAVQAATGFDDVFILGYAQGYLAYIVHPDDFWFGGYEAASMIFGPGFMDYLVARGVAVAERVLDPSATYDFPVLESHWTGPAKHTDWVTEQALGEPAITEQPTSDGGLRVVRWVGGDPAVDPAVVALEQEVDGDWQPVLRDNGARLTSDGPEIDVTLSVDPKYGGFKAEPRTFTYTARLPALFSVPPLGGQPTGTFRFVVEGQRPEAYTLTSEPFTL